MFDDSGLLIRVGDALVLVGQQDSMLTVLHDQRFSMATVRIRRKTLTYPYSDNSHVDGLL